MAERMEKGKKGVSAAEEVVESASEMIDFKGDGVGTGMAPGAEWDGWGEQDARSGIADCPAEMSQMGQRTRSASRHDELRYD